MSGTVIQDADEIAEIFYKVSINILNGRDPLEGTGCKGGESVNFIIMPHKGILINL